jgi:hypothetical protein
LTFIIKQDIAHINKQIAALQSSIKQRNAQGTSKSVEGKQIEEHNHNVVMLLQSKLATASMTFKDVLEVRTQVSQGARVPDLLYVFDQNMKESKDRTEQFMYSTASAANQTPSSSLSGFDFVTVAEPSLIFQIRYFITHGVTRWAMAVPIALTLKEKAGLSQTVMSWRWTLAQQKRV